MERRTHLIEKELENMSYAELLKEGGKAGNSEHGTKILGISRYGNITEISY